MIGIHKKEILPNLYYETRDLTWYDIKVLLIGLLSANTMWNNWNIFHLHYILDDIGENHKVYGSHSYKCLT